MPVASLLAGLFFAPPPAEAASIGVLAGTGERPNATRLSFTAGDSVQAQVDVGSGNLLVTVRGVALRGVLSNVQVGAWYNTKSVPDGPDTRMGRGWGLDFTSDVQLFEHGDNSVTYHGPGGLTGNFPRVTGSTTRYTSAPGFKADLVKTSDGWTLTDRQSREKRTFDSDGQLVRVADRSGNPIDIDSSAGAAGVEDERITASSVVGAFTTPARIGEVRTVSGVTTVGQTSGTSSRAVRFTHTGDTVTQFRDALNRLTSFSYDTEGRLTQISAPGSVNTRFVYDSSDRVVQIGQLQAASPGSSYTRLAYPSTSQTLVASPENFSSAAVGDVPHTTYTLDSSDRVTKVVDAEGRTQSTTYTANFDTATATSGTGTGAGTTTNTYGANSGQSVTQSKAPGGATSTLSYATAAPNQYQPSGGSDDAGNASTYTYSPSGQPLTATDAEASVAKVAYQDNGAIGTATSPGNGSNVTDYNCTDRLLTGIVPVTGSSLRERNFTYDAFGRTATSTNGRGITTVYSYDALDRLTGLDFNPGGTIEFGYDTAGRLAERSDPNSNTTWTYDNLGRQTSRTNSAFGGTISYAYNRDSQLIETNNAALSGNTTYSYDRAGLLTQVGYSHAGEQQTLKFANDNQGRRTDTWLDSDGTDWAAHNHVDYDSTGRTKRVIAKVAADETIVDLEYCYNTATVSGGGCSTNPATDRSKLVWKLNRLSGEKTTYSYDKAGRLTNAALSTNQNFAYTYNKNGARTSAVGTAQTDRTYTFNPANQLTNTGYGYDGAGNLTQHPNEGRITYTEADQMASVTKGGQTYTYTYSGESNDELIRQTTPNGTYKYAYGRTSPEGVPTLEAVSLDDQRSAAIITDPITGRPLMLRTANRAQSMYIYDGTPGSPIALATTRSEVAVAIDYDPFGTQTVADAGDGEELDQNPYYFAAGVRDRTTGWTRFGARYYDAYAATFTQQDSLDAPLDPLNGNRYAYAGNDPINLVDPTGQQTFECLLAVGLGLGSGIALVGSGTALLSAAITVTGATRGIAPGYSLIGPSLALIGNGGLFIGGAVSAGLTC